jgi:hypothetical protein
MDVWNDFKRGLAVIRGWRREDWKRFSPVFIIGAMLLAWFLYSNISETRKVGDRPLYERAPDSLIISPSEPFLVTEQDASDDARDFIADDDYRYFKRALEEAGGKLAGQNAGDDPVLSTALENLELSLPEGERAGSLTTTELMSVEEESAQGRITASYTVDGIQYPVLWDVIFARQGDGWVLESIRQSGQDDEEG